MSKTLLSKTVPLTRNFGIEIELFKSDGHFHIRTSECHPSNKEYFFAGANKEDELFILQIAEIWISLEIRGDYQYLLGMYYGLDEAGRLSKNSTSSFHINGCVSFINDEKTARNVFRFIYERYLYLACEAAVKYKQDVENRKQCTN